MTDMCFPRKNFSNKCKTTRREGSSDPNVVFYKTAIDAYAKNSEGERLGAIEASHRSNGNLRRQQNTKTYKTVIRKCKEMQQLKLKLSIVMKESSETCNSATAVPNLFLFLMLTTAK
eukprot:998746_1